MKDIDRREFLKITGSSLAAATGVSSLAVLLNMGESYKFTPIYQVSQKIVSMKGGGAGFLLRPPGARGEEDFLSKCIKCYLCVEACPLQAIKIAGREKGKASDTPYIIPEVTGCDLCLTRDNMRCNHICPTDALEKISTEDVKAIHDKMKMGQEKNMGIAILDKRICYAWTGVSACWACHEICPYKDKAITVGDRRAVHAVNAPTFHVENCVGCGLCVEICPVPQKAVRMVYQGEEAVIKAMEAAKPEVREEVEEEGKTSFSVEETESRAISDTVSPEDIELEHEKEHREGGVTEHKPLGVKRKENEWQPPSVDVMKF
jgi:ferredoxin-type protein NapG